MPQTDPVPPPAPRRLCRSSFGPEALIGPLAGAGIPDLLELAQTEGVYVNFHTEEYPAGAIRGQLEPGARGAAWRHWLPCSRVAEGGDASLAQSVGAWRMPRA